MNNKYPTIDLKQAESSGLEPLTLPYALNERWMLDRVIKDMERGKISYRLVIEEPTLPELISVWK